MRPPDAIGRCQACQLQAALWDALCIACVSRCRFCAGTGRATITYRWRPGPCAAGRAMAYVPPRSAWRTCQACRGSGRVGRAA